MLELESVKNPLLVGGFGVQPGLPQIILQHLEIGI